MIVSLLLDWGRGSRGAELTALGRPLAAYPLASAEASSRIKTHFALVAAPRLRAVCAQYGAVVLEGAPQEPPRDIPAYLMAALRAVQAELKGEPIDLLALFAAHSPAVSAETVEVAFSAMDAQPEPDSAATLVPAGYFHPLHALTSSPAGLYRPYLEEPPGVPEKSAPEVWFPDLGLIIARPKLIASPPHPGPFGWLGRKIFPIKREGLCPVEYEGQSAAAEFWLRAHGYPDVSPHHEPKPQPQAAPRSRP